MLLIYVNYIIAFVSEYAIKIPKKVKKLLDKY